jgi:hypothetical protein
VIDMPSQFNTLVQGLSIDSITPQQILAAGSPVFLDINTNADISSINKLIQSYARIHTPTYGQPIPMSGSISSIDGAGTVLAPSSNEMRKIIRINVVNAGGVPVVGTITLGGMVVAGFAADPTSTTIIEQQSQNLFASKNLPLAVTVTSGTASDLTTNVASLLVVQ